MKATEISKETKIEVLTQYVQHGELRENMLKALQNNTDDKAPCFSPLAAALFGLDPEELTCDTETEEVYLAAWQDHLLNEELSTEETVNKIYEDMTLLSQCFDDAPNRKKEQDIDLLTELFRQSYVGDVLNELTDTGSEADPNTWLYVRIIFGEDAIDIHDEIFTQVHKQDHLTNLEKAQSFYDQMKKRLGSNYKKLMKQEREEKQNYQGKINQLRAKKGLAEIDFAAIS